MKLISRQQILKANKDVHSALVTTGEYQKSPHFLMENVTRVREQLIRDVLPKLENKNIDAIDLGCGTGFMIDILLEFANRIDGVDITQEMLDKVDTSSGKVQLHLSEAERTPFPDNMFDLATAYSFMDHLENINPFLIEIFRILKPGGVFFTGLNPNKTFANFIKFTADVNPQKSAINPTFSKELKAIIDNGGEYEKKYGIDKKVLEIAENIKSNEGGFDPLEFTALAKKVGFSDVKTSHEWFLGQAHYSREGLDEAPVEKYLKSIEPASDALFKYVSFVLVK